MKLRTINQQLYSLQNVPIDIVHDNGVILKISETHIKQLDQVLFVFFTETFVLFNIFLVLLLEKIAESVRLAFENLAWDGDDLAAARGVCWQKETFLLHLRRIFDFFPVLLICDWQLEMDFVCFFLFR